MRELTPNEVEKVSGGVLWLVLLPVLLGGCATGKLRKGEKPPEA